MLSVYFDGDLVTNGEFTTMVPGYRVRDAVLDFSWTFNPRDLYTVIAYSGDTVPYINLLAVNIHENNLHESDLLLPYVPPSPGTTFVIEVYRQSGMTSHVTPLVDRSFVPSYLKTGLTLIAKAEMQISEGTSNMSSRSSGRSGSSRSGRSSGRTRRGRNTLMSNSRRSSSGRSSFKRGASRNQEKWCSCVLKVAQKGSRYNSSRRGESRPVNPYAVCTKNLGGPYLCGDYYDFEKMSDEDIRTYAQLSKVQIPRPYNREKMLDNIYEWKDKEGKEASRRSSPRRSRR